MASTRRVNSNDQLDDLGDRLREISQMHIEAVKLTENATVINRLLLSSPAKYYVKVKKAFLINGRRMGELIEDIGKLNFDALDEQMRSAKRFVDEVYREEKSEIYVRARRVNRETYSVLEGLMKGIKLANDDWVGDKDLRGVCEVAKENFATCGENLKAVAAAFLAEGVDPEAFAAAVEETKEVVVQAVAKKQEEPVIQVAPKIQAAPAPIKSHYSASSPTTFSAPHVVPAPSSAPQTKIRKPNSNRCIIS